MSRRRSNSCGEPTIADPNSHEFYRRPVHQLDDRHQLQQHMVRGCGRCSLNLAHTQSDCLCCQAQQEEKDSIPRYQQLLAQHQHAEAVPSVDEVGRLKEIEANKRRMEQRGEYEAFLVGLRV